MSTIPSTVIDEVREIVHRHLNELAQYLPGLKPLDEPAPGQILFCLEQLANLCQPPVEHVTAEQYRNVCSYRYALQHFLSVMSQPLDTGFTETRVGQILALADRWREAVAQDFELTRQQVWDWIAPVKPDTLEGLGAGQYEARWWKPVPVMDIEILRHTEGVVLLCDPFEPPNLYGGIAVRFSICPGE